MIGLRLAVGAIALMAVATAGIGGLAIIDDQARLGVAPPLRLVAADDSAFWRGVVSGAQAAANARGVELEVEWPRTEPTSAISDAPASDCSHETIGTLYGRHAVMHDAVLAVDIMPSASGNLHPANSCDGRCTLYVSMANYAAGRLCAQTADEAMPSGGAVAVLLEANPSKEVSGRFDGFRTYFRHRHRVGSRGDAKEIDVVVHHVDRRSPARLRQLAREIQASGAHVVIDFTDAAVEPLLGGLADVGPSHRSRVITFDSSDRALEAIERGNLLAIVTPDPFECGYQAVSRASLLQQRGLMEHPAKGRGSILLPPQVVRQGAVAEFRASRRVDRQM